MLRHGLPIETYPLKDQVSHGITYSTTFAEVEACVAAGLDPWKWESGEYPQEFKARIVAWFQLDRLVETHVEDARAEKMKAKARRR